jgi:kynurenine 3-monooxygenase
LYSLVAFSDTPYSVAYKKGQEQTKIMDQVMSMPDIETRWDSEEVMQKILSYV